MTLPTVTQNGVATVNGTQAIVLSVKVPSGGSTVPSAPRAHIVSSNLILYGDARTYQPLRRVLRFGGAPGLFVADWVPATPENIAQATNNSIPAISGSTWPCCSECFEASATTPTAEP